MHDIPKELKEHVRHVQEMYSQWLMTPAMHQMEIIPAGVLSEHLQYLYEYLDILAEKEESLPVSVAWLVEQVIGAMYEYNVHVSKPTSS